MIAEPRGTCHGALVPLFRPAAGATGLDAREIVGAERLWRDWRSSFLNLVVQPSGPSRWGEAIRHSNTLIARYPIPRLR
jgi:hypothetical protein